MYLMLLVREFDNIYIWLCIFCRNYFSDQVTKKPWSMLIISLLCPRVLRFSSIARTWNWSQLAWCFCYRSRCCSSSSFSPCSSIGSGRCRTFCPVLRWSGTAPKRFVLIRFVFEGLLIAGNSLLYLSLSHTSRLYNSIHTLKFIFHTWSWTLSDFWMLNFLLIKLFNRIIWKSKHL